jgi:hypothetical protein
MAKGATQKGGQKEICMTINAWAAIRDMAIAAMSKGQLLLLALCGVLVIFACRIPSESIPKLFDEVINRLCNGYLAGYGLWLISITSWFFHARWQRKLMHNELQRVTKERNMYQRQVLGNGNVVSSKE